MIQIKYVLAKCWLPVLSDPMVTGKVLVKYCKHRSLKKYIAIRSTPGSTGYGMDGADEKCEAEDWRRVAERGDSAGKPARLAQCAPAQSCFAFTWKKSES